ncbi:NTP transferase domain-containing protein [Mycobacterium sp. NPDC048908]|uniref:phosphocholine cytidylyltransferase family protein n=1 Tax=Mycobacterium sp. NPDC048908 TaxID=3364292 RepID=UPI003712058A
MVRPHREGRGVMGTPYQAVILAAGLGSRLHTQTKAMPKALLPLGPRSRIDRTETCFLRRNIELLLDAGVAEIVVVVGWQRDLIIAAVEEWGLPVTLVVNTTPDIGQSGSLHSLQFAARSGHGVLDGRMQTIVMDADIVYHPRAVATLIEAPQQSSLLICERFTGDGEEVLVYGSVAHPRFIGKSLTSNLVAGEPCLGEATGIMKFAPADHALCRETMDWMLGDPDAPEGSAAHKGFGPARRATEHEELAGRMMAYGRMTSVRFGPDIPFMECDNALDYKKVREAFYPCLLDLEAEEERASSCR